MNNDRYKQPSRWQYSNVYHKFRCQTRVQGELYIHYLHPYTSNDHHWLAKAWNWRTMCFKVECSQWKKFPWKGCGKHVANVYGSIEQGKHCTCRPWPGVNVKSGTENSNPKASVSGKWRWASFFFNLFFFIVMARLFLLRIQTHVIYNQKKRKTCRLITDIYKGWGGRARGGRD